MHRHEGSFPIRTLVLDVGNRRPLGVGAGGLAILAAIGDEKQTHRELPSNTGERVALIQNKINLGVTAVGHPFHNCLGQAIGALSVAALPRA
jgi:DNA-binding IclR family transcriptional regulator